MLFPWYGVWTKSLEWSVKIKIFDEAFPKKLKSYFEANDGWPQITKNCQRVPVLKFWHWIIWHSNNLSWHIEATFFCSFDRQIFQTFYMTYWFSCRESMINISYPFFFIFIVNCKNISQAMNSLGVLKRKFRSNNLFYEHTKNWPCVRIDGSKWKLRP